MVKRENKIQTAKASKLVGISSSSSSTKRKYKGVRMRSWGSWVSEIRAPNQKTRIWLGSYSTAEAAARAYDAALLCLKGCSAANNLNFPITPSHYIPDTVMSPKSIQRVAAAAAASCFTDTAAASSPVSSPPVPCSAPSPSPSSSSSSSTSCQSPYDQQPDVYDGDVLSSLMQSFETYSHDGYLWSEFDDQLQSPTTEFLDQPFIDINGDVASSFSPPPPPTMEDFFGGDIRLWSFPE